MLLVNDFVQLLKPIIFIFNVSIYNQLCPLVSSIVIISNVHLLLLSAMSICNHLVLFCLDLLPDDRGNA